jgi:hypothetical protein
LCQGTLFVSGPPAACTVLELDLDRFGFNVGAEPLGWRRPADCLARRNEPDELSRLFIPWAWEGEFDFVDWHVAGVVDMEGDFAASVWLAVNLDPRADPGGLGSALVLGPVSLAALFLAEQHKPDDERSDGAYSGEGVRADGNPAVSQGAASRFQ